LEGIMIERRTLMSAGLAAGVASMAPAPSVEAAQRGDTTDGASRAVDELRQEILRQFDTTEGRPWRTVGRIREQQRQWLRSTQKYPDFMEIGLDVWDSMQDWHVRERLPLNATRLADGRYAMLFSFTTLILRTDAMPDYVGPAFDNDTRR
jgi:hypothetical protein